MGWQGYAGGGADMSFEFRRTEQGWMIDKFFLHPVNEPGGNQIREREDPEAHDDKD